MNRFTPVSSFCSVFLSILLLSGCSEPKEVIMSPNYSDSDTPTELIPLTLGNTWTRLHRVYNDETLWKSEVNTLVVEDVITVDEVEWFLTTDDEDSVYVRNTPEGLMELSTETSIFKMRFKYPVEPGIFWYGRDGRRYFTVNTNSTVEVRAGTFYGCIHYRSVGDQFDPIYDYWIKPGIGHVKTIWWDNGQNVYELVAYNLE